MAYLVDADWIINAAHNRRRADEILALLSPAGIYVSLITLGEIYDSAYDSPNPEAYIDSYKKVFGQFAMAILNEAVMSKFAE